LLFFFSPQLILSTKEVNEKARSLAYRLVLDVGRSSQSFLGGSAEGQTLLLIGRCSSVGLVSLVVF